MWVKRLLDNKNCLWQEIPRYYLRKVGLWPVDINLDPLCYKSNKLPKFYNVCLQDWSSLFSQEPKDAVSVMAQPLWNNQLITKDGKSYWYKEFSNAGLIHISDIINPDARAWQARDDYHVSDSRGYDYGYDYGYVCDYDY